MPQANLSRTPEVIDTSADSVVIALLLEDIPGGRTLDVTGVTDEVIKAGHVIVEETATGALKPLGVTDGAYASLPSGHTYKGVLVGTIPTARPMASIMVRGRVNPEAAVNAQGLPNYPAAAITALSLIRFAKD